MINIYWPHENRSGISDQLWCLNYIFLSHSIPYTISKRLDPISTNIVIENLDPHMAQYVRQFCAMHRQKIVLLPTEHFKRQNIWNQCEVNGLTLKTLERTAHSFYFRFEALRLLRGCFRAFISVGGAPDLMDYAEEFEIDQKFSLGFPFYESELFKPKTDGLSLYFSGAATRHRQSVIKNLKENGIDVRVETGFVDDSIRSRALLECGAVLNIPQDEKWHWFSVMRGLFALRHGKLIVNIGAKVPEGFTKYVVNLSSPNEFSVNDVYEAYKNLNASVGKSINLADCVSDSYAEQKRFLDYLDLSC